MMRSDEQDRYWAKWVLASIAVAAATAVANECAKVLADALRERWKLSKPKDEGK